ncbi:MAG: hypothetical protein AAGE65_04775 [Planctomycetota bacterium]
MNRKTRFALTAPSLVFAATVTAQPATVDFESVAVGTQFGSGFGQAPGDLIFTEDGVPVSIDNFTLGAFVGFNNVTIGGFTDPTFPTTPATINNVRLVFDLSGLDPITEASFEFADFGGDENLVVNGVLAEVADFGALPAVLGGVNVGVTSFTSSTGLVTLTGNITSLEIGGQELGIDNVTFVPEPAMAGLAIAGVSLMLRRKR